MAGPSALSGVWRPLTPGDLPRLAVIEAELHPGLPERAEVMAEKLSLFPAGCRKLVQDGVMVGYAIAHPWQLFDIPALDTFLGAIPPDADCLYMHDVAVLPEGRGRGAAPLYVDILRGLARERGLGALACVSVYGTVPLWASMGFGGVSDQRLDADLTGYGPTATYMVATL